MLRRSEEYCGEAEEVSSLAQGIAAQVRIESWQVRESRK